MLGKPKRISNPKLLEEVRQQRCALTHDYGNEQDPVVVHHLETIGSRGDDVEWNLLPIKASLHTDGIHRWGISKTIEKYPRLEKWLLKHGWTFCEVTKKWRHC